LVNGWLIGAKFILTFLFCCSRRAVPFAIWRTELLRSLIHKAKPSESFAESLLCGDGLPEQGRGLLQHILTQWLR
jgi:hypothetical protein